MTTRYTVPAGAHSVSARGREFVADENGEIDLAGIDTGTLLDLVTFAGIHPTKTEEQKQLEAEALKAKVMFEAAAAHAAQQAKANHDSVVDDALRKHEHALAQNGIQAENDAAVLAAHDAARHAASVEIVTHPESADPQNAPDSLLDQAAHDHADAVAAAEDDEAAANAGATDWAGSRSVTPPRRKPRNG